MRFVRVCTQNPLLILDWIYILTDQIENVVSIYAYKIKFEKVTFMYVSHYSLVLFTFNVAA